MKQRIITAVIGIGLFIPVLIFSHTWVYPIFMSLLSVAGTFEMIRCVGMIRKYFLSVPLLMLSLAMPITVRLFSSSEDYALLYVKVLIVLLVYFLSLPVFSKAHYSFAGVAAAVCTSVYVILGFTATIMVRDVPYGAYLFLLVFIGPWISDVFALLCGLKFGKHKLIPEISPKKTVEGSVGAILLTPLFILLYAWVVSQYIDVSLNMNILGVVLVGMLLSAIGQIGDLIASAIKRQYEIKDYGKLFPGHGGVMDRFDSVLPAAIILYMYTFLPSITNVFH